MIKLLLDDPRIIITETVNAMGGIRRLDNRPKVGFVGGNIEYFLRNACRFELIVQNIREDLCEFEWLQEIANYREAYKHYRDGEVIVAFDGDKFSKHFTPYMYCKLLEKITPEQQSRIWFVDKKEGK